MTTQYLPSIEAREAQLPNLLKSVSLHHEIDRNSIQSIMHYNPTTGGLVDWFWPRDSKGTRIPPDQLVEEHSCLLFDGPCCLCAYLDGSEYTECKLGIVETVGGDQPLATGQYAFQCARDRCGYYVLLDEFFTHPKLLASTYPKRKDILDNGEFGGPLSQESVGYLGIRQMTHSERNVLRGPTKKLRRETPHILAKWRLDFENLATEGLSEARFWDLFVQCMDCKVILPRFLFPYRHSCAKRALNLRNHIWAPASPSFMDGLRHRLSDDTDDDESTSDDSAPSTAPCSPVPGSSKLQIQSQSSIYQTPPRRPVPDASSVKRKRDELESEGDDIMEDNGNPEGDAFKAHKRRRTTTMPGDEQDVFALTDSSSDLPVEISDLLQHI